MRFTFLLFFIVAGTINPGYAQKLFLNDSWTLSSSARNMELPVQVPGTLYGDLLKHGLTANVMIGDHEADIQWIETGNWIYTRNLDVTNEILDYKHVELVFEGLDTYAKVYVNDSLVITAFNMFREWRVDVKPLLRKGQNTIRVVFLPNAELAQIAKSAFPYRLPQTDTSANAISSFARKAAYHFGWDWAPRIPDRGICRPVYLELSRDVKIRSFTVHTISIKKNIAYMEARLNIKSDTSFKHCYAKINGTKYLIDLSKGLHRHTFRWAINNPELWWPNGSGKPALHDFNVQVIYYDKVLDAVTARAGIRTVELIRESDSIGTAFYFKVNGRPVFMQGANYVPPYVWDTSTTKREIIESAKAVGMNMLRVWGGGVYEEDEFYSLCDENGIMVWQDFMFACAMYPGDSLFLENVREEVRQNADRISGHPSLALWCGNNESDVAWKNWGWQKQFGFSASDSTAIYEAYIKLFQNLIPGVLSDVDPFTPYVHTSPLSNWGKKENFNHHNMHYWGVWHGEEPVDSFRVNVPRFMTEYGMQSFPSFETMKQASDSDSIILNSGFINSRQKSYKGNKLLFSYISERYQTPQSVEELSYFSQLAQADAMDIAIRSHRMTFGHCMGTLYWQLNDVWPGASWSTLEYNGTWKAAHYRLKDLYAPDLLIPVQDGDSLHVYYVSSDTAWINASIDVDVMTLSGKPLGVYAVPEIHREVQGEEVFVGSIAELAPDSTDAVVRILLSSNGKVIASALHYFVKPNQLKLIHPNLKHSLTRDGDNIVITLETDVVAKGVYLQFKNTVGDFSENYFDLLPGKPKVILFTPDQSMASGINTGELLIRTYNR